MKRTYPIREWKAIEQFRSHLSNDPGTIQDDKVVLESDKRIPKPDSAW
jgi:hypothetical protein